MERLTEKVNDYWKTNDKAHIYYLDTNESVFVGNAIDRLAELEDVLEKFNIDDATQLDSILNSIRTNTLIDIQNKEILELENANLRTELAELKQKAIVPKYKTGDKVYGIIDTWAYTDVRPVEIRGTHLLYEVWDGEDTTKQHSTRIFTTKEEAEQKLAEVKGE